MRKETTQTSLTANIAGAHTLWYQGGCQAVSGNMYLLYFSCVYPKNRCKQQDWHQTYVSREPHGQSIKRRRCIGSLNRKVLIRGIYYLESRNCVRISLVDFVSLMYCSGCPERYGFLLHTQFNVRSKHPKRVSFDFERYAHGVHLILCIAPFLPPDASIV